MINVYSTQRKTIKIHELLRNQVTQLKLGFETEQQVIKKNTNGW